MKMKKDLFEIFNEESYHSGNIYNLHQYISKDGRYRMNEAFGWPEGFKIMLAEGYQKYYRRPQKVLLWGTEKGSLCYIVNPSEKDIRNAFAEGNRLGEPTEEEINSDLPF